jgi:hypothetical protein
MMIDESKLIPAPWYVQQQDLGTDDHGEGPAGLAIGPYEDDEADCFMFSNTFSAREGPEPEVEAVFEFTVLSRNIFAMMAKTGWGVTRFSPKSPDWIVVNENGDMIVMTGCTTFKGRTPLAALAAAYEWWSAKRGLEAKSPCG